MNMENFTSILMEQMLPHLRVQVMLAAILSAVFQQYKEMLAAILLAVFQQYKEMLAAILSAVVLRV